MERAYRHSTLVLGRVLLVLGVVIVVATLVRGGGPLASGVVVGVALAAFGGARSFLAGRTPPPRGRA